MELDGMKERMTMGVKESLKAGKANTGQDRYGYQRVGDQIVIIEGEARWVRRIFEWYLDGCRLMEIRDRTHCLQCSPKRQQYSSKDSMGAL